jgi:hypothetical protein
MSTFNLSGTGKSKMVKVEADASLPWVLRDSLEITPASAPPPQI